MLCWLCVSLGVKLVPCNLRVVAVLLLRGGTWMSFLNLDSGIIALNMELSSKMLNKTLICSPYLSAHVFCNSPIWNVKFDELDFFPSLNWIFLPAVACKIQVWNKLNIKFIKVNILKLENCKNQVHGGLSVRNKNHWQKWSGCN